MGRNAYHIQPSQDGKAQNAELISHFGRFRSHFELNVSWMFSTKIHTADSFSRPYILWQHLVSENPSQRAFGFGGFEFRDRGPNPKALGPVDP